MVMNGQTNTIFSQLMYFYRVDDYDLLATDIQEKTPKEVKKYYLVFKKKWKQLAGMSVNRADSLWSLR